MVFRRMAWRAAWGYLALVLMLAPLMGLMHGVVHGAGAFLPHTEEVHVHASGHVHEHEHAQEHGWLADLFSAHAGDSDCRVYDQLCHSDVVPAPTLLVLPIALSSFLFHLLQGEVLARRAALFEARGPPPAR